MLFLFSAAIIYVELFSTIWLILVFHLHKRVDLFYLTIRLIKRTLRMVMCVICFNSIFLSLHNYIVVCVQLLEWSF